ncbi:hypothetical protein BRC71_00045 [Halobacteriales archaeon QH_7_65_31]|nr:MAG: hypothetical protein BRC71_00045 [Halobacteriales archaeon QH_7_65_31]
MITQQTRRKVLSTMGFVAFAGCTTGQTQNDSSPTETKTSTAGSPDVPNNISSDWPMPRHDPSLSGGVSSLPGPTGSVAELWRIQTEKDLSTPIVTGNRLYVTSRDGSVFCFDARSGDKYWQISTESASYSPFFVAEQIFIPTRKRIISLSPDDGTEIWSKETPNRRDLYDSENVINKPTVVAASHGIYFIGGESEPTVVCLAIEDGSRKWTQTIGDPWERYLFASDDRVFVATGHNGQIPWSIKTQTGKLINGPEESGADFKDERYYKEGVIYSVDEMFGQLVSNPISEDKDGWTKSVPAGVYALGGNSEHVYMTVAESETPGVYAISTTDGTVEWVNEMEQGPRSPPIVTEQSIITRTGEEMRGLDTTDGKATWKIPNLSSDGETIVAGDVVYSVDHGVVTAFR